MNGTPRLLFRILFLQMALLCAFAARAEEGRHVFWEVAGRNNTVYLLGSVHVLHASDSALPDVADEAYARAGTLVAELDLFAASAELMSAEAMAMQTLPDGQTLQQVLGPELHARLAEAARPLGVDTDFLARMQPWFVATMLTQLRAQRAGYSAETGVDYQLSMRARRDGKPIVGLETAMDQLAVLASMSLPEQRGFLAATLDESSTVEELKRITEAWRNGELDQLEDLLREGAEESPEFFQRLVVDRNLKWLPQVEAMLQAPSGDYLVVTGAAHMVGEQGLVELLRSKGYTITRK